MKIEHIAIWSKDIDRLKDFYIDYFNGTSNKRYTNNIKGFESFFLSFSDGSRIEIMSVPEVLDNKAIENMVGLTHIAFSTGSKENVDKLTKRLADDGYTIKCQPRYTGDGYYESVVLDPDGNIVEITE